MLAIFILKNGLENIKYYADNDQPFFFLPLHHFSE